MSGKSKNSDFWSSSTFKGIIAVLSTLLVVVIITLVSAKLLFVGNSSGNTIKTGRITSTEPLAVTTTVKTKHTEKTTKKTNSGDDDFYSEDTGDYTTQTVISAVYLHPEPTSKSENLCVIPVGAECKVYKNENGWLYLDYDGQKGYAYYTFFTE
ncbi:MAG: SH3 domain-containing protein [Oscillospiraceae bacterium]